MSDEHNHITDRELRALLKKRMLEADASDALAEQLLEQEAMLAFGADAVFTPSAEKEKQLLKTEKKPVFRFRKWLLPLGIVIVVVAAFVICKTAAKKINAPAPLPGNTLLEKKETVLLSDSAKTYVKELAIDTSAASFNRKPKGKMQLIKTLLKENSDCSHAIWITDTVIYSPHSPVGAGNDAEIQGNGPDDPMSFEEEHNTVWYKFVVPESGQLTFDIIPVNKNDDYDFMLFKWDGGDFRAKVMNKKIRPVKACISRNDKRLNSMTGLSLNGSLPSFIHSGEGASYVQFLNVNKGETYYLLVDNVYGSGNGHTIKFHYKVIKPGELFVGQLISLDNIKFWDSQDKFYPGSEKGLEDLYAFLVKNAKLKIEIQGHINPLNAPFKLSEERALAIYKYLIKKGIAAARLSHVGFGGNRPVVANPRNPKEAYKNVRADIKIVSLDYEKDLELSKQYQSVRRKNN